METSTTHHIVESLTRAIVEHRLLPGAKLAGQKLADHFGVSERAMGIRDLWPQQAAAGTSCDPRRGHSARLSL